MSNAKDEKKSYLTRFHYTVEQVIEKPFNWKQMLRLLII